MIIFDARIYETIFYYLKNLNKVNFVENHIEDEINLKKLGSLKDMYI